LNLKYTKRSTDLREFLKAEELADLLRINRKTIYEAALVNENASNAEQLGGQCQGELTEMCGMGNCRAPSSSTKSELSP
jgi:hypothetical protein